MKIVQPRVIMIASTKPSYLGLGAMLREIGAEGWVTDAQNEGEELIEVAGRLCYRSFAPGLNKNVTKVREGNMQYIENILKQKHGSVLEHATVTFAFLNVSRIFTHEVCRHRAGTAFSQESMRYVRLDDIPMYLPEPFYTSPPGGIDEERINEVSRLFEGVVTASEVAIRRISEIFELDKDSVKFEFKKKITSALRRLAPGGHTTNIIMTANHRAWRHMIELRTSEGAEEEIRKIFLEVGNQLHQQFQAIYQDMKQTTGGVLTFENSKV